MPRNQTTNPAGSVELPVVADLVREMRQLATLAFHTATTGPDGLSADDLLAEVVALQELSNVVAATQLVRVAHFAAVPAGHPSRTGEVACFNEFADADLETALSLGPRATDRLLLDAERLTHRTPQVLGAMATGGLDRSRAGLVADLTSQIPDSATLDAVVDDAMNRGLCGKTWAQTRRMVNSLVRKHCPESVLTRRAKAARERVGVSLTPSDIDGLTEWRATINSEDAVRAFAAVDTLARELKERDTTGMTLGQAQAAAMTDLILGNACVETHVMLRVPIQQHHTGPHHLGDVQVPGVGIIAGELIEDLLRSVGTRIHRVLTDKATGTVVSTTTGAYRPTARIRAFVQARDETCRFPSCTRPVKYCDLDHVQPWSTGGTTSPDNLQALCRHHHRVKHHTKWTVTMSNEAVCDWTSPAGHHYLTYPPDYHERAGSIPDTW